MYQNSFNNNNYDELLDHYFYEIGVNIIPADTKNKQTNENWSQWQDKPIPDELHEQRKKNGEYNKGIALIPGKIWRSPFKGKYLVAIDLDNKKAIEEFCKDGLDDLKQQTLVEQTSNPEKMHIYFIVEREIPNKSSDKTNVTTLAKINENEIPALEVKSNGKGIMFCADSPHKNGSNYRIIGTLTPKVFDAQVIEDRIGSICDKYNIPYGFYNNNGNLDYQQIPIEDLFKPGTKILAGHNRHKELLRAMDSLLARNRGILSPNKIKELAYDWNNEHCVPPLDDREFEKEWKQSFIFVAKGIISSNNNNNTSNYTGNGNGHSSQNKHSSNNSTNIPKEDSKILLLPREKNYFEFVVKSIKKTVKCEDALIRQILYTGFSAYIPDKTTNLGILAPTSEGKTYAVTETLQYFPEEDVEIVGKMSTMALVRQKGILIDKNGQPIDKQVRDLFKRKSLLGGKKEDREEKLKIIEEIHELLEDAKTLIDLSGKILVFLEPPRNDLWDLLKPILSHDKKEIKFDFVNQTDREGHQTKKVIVRGWPACIFCSAKDESKWEIWSEIKSRFSIASPNMIPQKYDESTQLIALNFGWPDSVQQHAIISDNDMEFARDCILQLKQTILKLQTKNNNNNKIPLWIPYNRLLQKQLPSNKGTDVRLQKRIFSLLNVIPIVKSNLRKLLVLGNEKSVIADLSDLKEVLSIIQNFDGIPKFKSDFFNNIFCSLYKTKTKPDESVDGSKKEDRRGVTSKQLALYYTEKTGRTISTDSVKNTYLNELAKNGMIDYELSKIHGKQYIYYPLGDSLNISENNDNNDKSSSTSSPIIDPIGEVSQDSSNIYEKITNNITETWLFSEIMVVLSHRLDLAKMQGPLADYLNTNLEFQLLQEENISSTRPIDNTEQEEETTDMNIKNNRNKLTIRQFTKNYLEQKSQNPIGEKGSPNNASFGKISLFSPIQAKIDEKDEKSTISEEEPIKDIDDTHNGKSTDSKTKDEVDRFLSTNHMDKVEKQEE